MKGQFSLVLLALLGLFILSSCSKDDKGKAQSDVFVPEHYLPTQFGVSYETLQSTNPLVKEGSFDSQSFTCTITPKEPLFADKFVKVTLYFDTSKIYRYATIEAKSFDYLKNSEFMSNLLSQDWKAYDGLSIQDQELIFKKDQYLLRVFTEATNSVKTPIILFGPDKQESTSWTRINSLNNGLHLWTPLIALGSSPELFGSFEDLLGHELNKQLTKQAEGLYVYETNGASYPKVEYQCDQTRHFIASRILLGTDNLPDEQALEEYIFSLGFMATGLSKDQNKF